MPKFTFICENLDDKTGAVTTKQFQTVTWDLALDEFASFLRASGYTIDANSIGVNSKKHYFLGQKLYNVTSFEQE